MFDSSSVTRTEQRFDTDRINQWFARFERWFAIALVLYHTNFLYLALSGRLSSEDPMAIRTIALESSPLLALLKGLILLGLVSVSILRGKLLLNVILRRKALLGLMLWIVVSTFWAKNPGDSLKWAIELGTVTLAGIYCAARFSIREFLGLAAIGMGLMVGINFLFCLAFPHFGIQTGLQAGAWRGLYIQKNTLARMMLFASLVFMSQLSVPRAMETPVKSHRRAQFWAKGALMICILLTVLSQSKTALLLIVGLFLFIPLCQTLRSRHPLALALLTCGALAGLMVALTLVGNYEAILAGLGRDPTLSGRTDIWEVMIDKIIERPWTGYGYAGFWHGKEGESIDIWYRSRDMPPHGHNGYLDLTLDLGLIGLGLFLSSFGQAMARSIVWLRRAGAGVALFPVLFLVAMMLYNISEDSLIAEPSSNLTWFLYCYVTSALLVQPMASQDESPQDLFVEANTEWTWEEHWQRSSDTGHSWVPTDDTPPEPAPDSEAEKLTMDRSGS